MLYIYNLDVSIYIGLKCVLNYIYIYIYIEREREILLERSDGCMRTFVKISEKFLKSFERTDIKKEKKKCIAVGP